MAVKLRKHIGKNGKNIPYLYIEANGTFYAKKRIGEQTPRRSLDTKVESVAVAKLFQTIKEMEDEIAIRKARAEGKEIPGSGKPKLLRDFYVDMVTEKNVKEVKAATLRRVDTVWRNCIEPFWGDLLPAEINKEKVQEFMVWHRKHKKGVQFKNTFKYLGNLFRIVAESGAIKLSDVPNLEEPLPEQRHHKSKKGRVISVSEFWKIHDHIPSEYQLIFKLAFFTGMREMEIGALRKNQVIKIENDYHFDFSHQDTKTGIERKPPIPPFLVDEVLKLTMNGGLYLFPAPTDSSRHISAKMIFQIWKKAKAAAGVQGRMRFHDMRHTVATNLVKANVNPLIIATHLGMTIKTLQEKYLNLVPQDLLVVNRSVIDLFEQNKTERGNNESPL